MPRCPNCSYKLVLLSSRPKYKCALCSKLYPEKEIEVKEFQEFNKRRRIEDAERFEKEYKEHLLRIREVKKNREILNAKARLKRQANPEPEGLKNRNHRVKNRDTMRTYGMIQHYRTKQKTLALQYLEKEDFKPSNEHMFHSVPTFALSYLLTN